MSRCSPQPQRPGSVGSRPLVQDSPLKKRYYMAASGGPWPWTQATLNQAVQSGRAGVLSFRARGKALGLTVPGAYFRGRWLKEDFSTGRCPAYTTLLPTPHSPCPRPSLALCIPSPTWFPQVTIPRVRMTMTFALHHRSSPLAPLESPAKGRNYTVF